MRSGPTQSFPASYDTTTRIFSAALIAAVAIVAVALHNAVFAGVATLLILVAYGYSPRGYAVQAQDRSIEVTRLIGKARISLAGLREARAAADGELRGSIRLWGNGGLFGYYGLFRTPKLGRCRWYLSSRKNAVVVVTDRQTVLLSPDDTEGFLASIRAAVPVSQVMPAGPPDALQLRTGGRWTGRIVAIVVGVAVTGILISTLLYSPGRPAYTLNSTSLTIHDRLYPVTLSAAAVDVDRIRVVDSFPDSEWRPVERTNGFANAHYRSGWFRAANGRKVRLYWANGGRLVLLPPKDQGDAVLVEVARPEEFVREVKEQWSRTH